MRRNEPVPTDATLGKRAVLTYALIALLGKALLTVMLVIDRMHDGTYGPLAHVIGDSVSYLDPIESLLAGRGYDPDFRMPGYGAVYLLFRLFFSPQGAGSAMVITQALTDGCSVVLLAITAFRLSGSVRVFRCVFWLYLIGATVSVFNIVLVAETFTTGAIVLSVFLMVSHAERGGRWRLLAAGIALCWAIFMKPVYLVLLPFLIGQLFLAHVSMRSRMVRALLFCVPFLVIDGAWTLRNARAHDRFIPLTDGAIYPGIVNSPRYPVMRFVQAFGGSFVSWDPKAEVRWFGADGGVRPGEHVELPTDLTATTFNRDSLEQVSRDMRRWLTDTSAQPAHNLLGARISSRMDRFRESFILEHPWRYHVFSRLRMTRLFLVRSGTEGLFLHEWPRLDPLAKGYKFLCSVLFMVIQFGGLCGAVVLLVLPTQRRRYGWIAAMALVCVLIFPIGLRMTEFRYLVPAWPWLTLLCCIGVHAGILRMRRASNVPRPVDPDDR